jgi:hypothetical protein
MTSKTTGSISDEAATPNDGGWERWRALTSDAYTRFHDKLLANRSLFPQLASFDAADRVSATRGTFAWWWGADGEVRETVNTLNTWGVHLHEWGAWNLVINSYDDKDDKWEVLYHFVNPLASFCMLQPSSLADRLMVAAETLLHQANQFVFPDEPDRLDQDNLAHGKTLRRSDRRRQLSRLGKPWTKFGAFRDALSAIDGKDYQKTSRNYRDLSAHSFAPNFMIGHVTRAIRSIVPKMEMVAQPDGTYLPVEHPTQKGVSYAAHSMEPLDLHAMRAANLAEYQKALSTMKAFSALVDEICIRMDAEPKRNAP